MTPFSPKVIQNVPKFYPVFVLFACTRKRNRKYQQLQMFFFGNSRHFFSFNRTDDSAVSFMASIFSSGESCFPEEKDTRPLGRWGGGSVVKHALQETDEKQTTLFRMDAPFNYSSSLHLPLRSASNYQFEHELYFWAYVSDRISDFCCSNALFFIGSQPIDCPNSCNCTPNWLNIQLAGSHLLHIRTLNQLSDRLIGLIET